MAQRWRPLPGEWEDEALAACWRLALEAKAEVLRVHHHAQQAKRLGALGETRVELRAEGEMGAALRSLGPELNDLLGSCAVRLVDAATEGPVAAAAEEAVVEETVEGRGGAPALRVALHAASDAPKCSRCWRHVPLAAVGAGEGVPMPDGWTYRGCICPPATRGMAPY